MEERFRRLRKLPDDNELRLALPDGSLEKVISELLVDAGLPVSYASLRSYRGCLRTDKSGITIPVSVYKLRPWDMGPLVRDGFLHSAVAADDVLWNSDCQDGRDITVLDHYPLARAGGSKTRLVVATPIDGCSSLADLLDGGVIATEYAEGVERWIKEIGFDGIKVLKCHGKLEAFTSFGVRAIVDNVESGDSLRANGLREIHQVLESQTCLFANKDALDDPVFGPAIQAIRFLLRSVIAAREHRMIACNVIDGGLEKVEAILQSAIGRNQRPTVNPLVNGGHAVSAAVPTASISELTQALSSAGASTIVTTKCEHFVP